MYLEQAVGEIEQTSAERVQKYTEKLYAKLKALLEDTNIDEAVSYTQLDVYKRQTSNSVDRAIGMLPDMVDKITALFNNKQKEQQAQGEARPCLLYTSRCV